MLTLGILFQARQRPQARRLKVEGVLDEGVLLAGAHAEEDAATGVDVRHVGGAAMGHLGGHEGKGGVGVGRMNVDTGTHRWIQKDSGNTGQESYRRMNSGCIQGGYR